MATDFLEKAVSTVPTKRQLDWMDVEYSGIIYFGMNTFTCRNEGTGFEEPEHTDVSAKLEKLFNINTNENKESDNGEDN